MLIIVMVMTVTVTDGNNRNGKDDCSGGGGGHNEYTSIMIDGHNEYTSIMIDEHNEYTSIMISDNFWSAFCVFHAHFWEKTHSFKICALKKRNDIRQLKRSNFRVKICKTDENLSKFLNNMAYKTVTSMRDCVMKRNFI